MSWSGLRISFQRIVLLSISLVLVLSTEPAEEKSYCTTDTCYDNGRVRLPEGTDKDRDSEIDIAYTCLSPNDVSSERTPVIFLHGLTDVKETWDGVYENVPVLTHRKVCIYDARNHGDSDRSTTFDIDVLAEDLGHFMDKMKIKKALLVGHSMGGLTVMKYALNNPSRVEGLFIEDIAPVVLEEHVLTFVMGWLDIMKSCISDIPADADEMAAKKKTGDCVRKATDGQVPESFTNNPSIRQLDGVWQWKVNFDAAEKALEVPTSFFTKYEGRYEGKTILAYGKTSLFQVNAQEKETKRLFPNAEFIGFEGAGHDIHHLHPDFNTELMKFLQ